MTIRLDSDGRRFLVNPDADPHRPDGPEKRLYSEGAFRGRDLPVLAPAGSVLQQVSGTPFLDVRTGELEGAYRASAAEVEGFRSLSARSGPRTPQRYAELAHKAMIDMRTLMLANGAVLAAASPYWAFVWARDNAFVVAALATAGAYEEAWAAVRFIFGVQEADGQWEARYLPDGSGEVPDDRGRQDDGIGYMLWAVWLVSRLDPGGLAEHRSGVLKAIEAGSAVSDEGTGLPRASQDFWETDQDLPSLGVAAPLAFGLRAGSVLATELGDPEIAARASKSARGLHAAIVSTYAPTGYERFPDGGGRDASTAFLLPPFGTGFPRAVAAWERSVEEMRVPNGGLRPGACWSDMETAWTPQVSLYALTAASLGDEARAVEFLDWLESHRTTLGCIPEKVTGAGKPAAVAPIGIVAASVLLALRVLDGDPLPILHEPFDFADETSDDRPRPTEEMQ